MTAVMDEYNLNGEKEGQLVVKYNLHEDHTLNHERIMTRVGWLLCWHWEQCTVSDDDADMLPLVDIR